MDEEPAPAAFCVLINGEEQYSLWPAALPPPQGWTRTGPSGPRDLCLAFVEANWTDMRPRSLREAMAADARARQSAEGDPS